MSGTIDVAATGVLLGLSIAAPVGPIGVLCIRRTLLAGRLVGFISGLGAATADATYAALGGFGLVVLSRLLVQQAILLHLIGGAFLAYLGVRTIRAQPAVRSTAVADRADLVGAYASTVGLTLSNPATILSFAAMFAGVAPAGRAGTAETVLLVGGVFVGSALWWLVLSTSVGACRSRLDQGALSWINRGSGLVLLGFSAIILLGVIGLARR